MKFTFTLLLLVICLHGFSQWSDTTNSFTDSLHMQVTTALHNQDFSIIVRSYPDSGYFVIWQDSRNDAANSKTAIYAQKYSKDGVALWAANGVPISASTNKQHYYNQTGGGDYRNHSYAATDSANGFYIAYADDSVVGSAYQRACLQHIQSNGTAVFGGPGNIISSAGSGGGGRSIFPQLIADGNGGVFFSFLGTAPVVGTPVRVLIFCYKDVGGTLQNYGGGQMNENAIQVTETSPCGNYLDLQNTDAEVQDYHIYSDLQGGCNVVMALNVNGKGLKLGYNKLWRAKKNSAALEYSLDLNYNPVANEIPYTKGNVYRLYYLKTDHQTISCGNGASVFVVTQNRLIQNGFQEVDGGAGLYALTFPKAVTVSTNGNINASLLAVWEKTYSVATGASDPIIKGYTVKEEIFDSIPYQRSSNNNPDYPGYNTVEPGSLNKLNNFIDTILSAPNNYDFCIGSGANQIYASGIEPGGIVRLQHIAAEQQTADSFALVYKSDGKTGSLIGQGSFDLPPMLAVNNAGTALYYVKDNAVIPGGISAIRVSPVFTATNLAWGAMGKPLGTGIWGSFYNTFNTFVSLDPVNGTALASWTTDRNNGTTGYDIYIRHLDDLNSPGYEPPYPRVKPANNPFGPRLSSATLYGTSNQFTTLSVYDGSYTTDPGVSPVADIFDNYNLGTVNLSVSDNTGPIRTINGKPYLDRSYTITPQNNPNGAATVTIRLFFTTAQFNAIQAADSSIKNPGYLAVIKQPGTGSGSTYTVVAGEQTVFPQSWAAVDGGYYIQIQITSFSNFFIIKNINASLAVTWLGVQAQWQNTTQAKVSWQTAEQQNVKNYTVQHSVNGIDFTNVCSVDAANQTQYSCIVPAGNSNYYRVMETDLDGKNTYSNVIQLKSTAQSAISLYPNPATDMLYINGIQKYYVLQVIDMKGNTVQQQTVTPANHLLDISHLSKGNYLLRLTGNTGAQTLKFIKQ